VTTTPPPAGAPSAGNRPTRDLLVRSLALGAATGARSATGIAAVALTSTAKDPDPLVARLGGRGGSGVTAVAALGELVADKLPVVPSRLGPPGLAPRVALGAASTAALARRAREPAPLPALVGAAGAVGGAVAGSRWRALAHRRFGSDRPGALIEDAVAALLAWYATRRSRAVPQPSGPDAASGYASRTSATAATMLR